jgi:2'-5' RNA ligase
MSAQRLFVAIDPAPPVREAIARALGRLRALAPRARWVDAGSLHVTLAFLGDVDEERVPAFAEATRAAARRHPPVELRFAGGGVFGGRRPRVLWGGVTGDLEALARAQRDLVEALAPLGYAGDEHAFSPHLTLARARDPRGDPAFEACVEALEAEDFGLSRVEALVLYRSGLGPTGPRYTPIATGPLGLP